jgi:hypothetical protein
MLTTPRSFWNHRLSATIGLLASLGCWPGGTQELAGVVVQDYVIVHDGRSFAIEAALPKLDMKSHPFTLRQSWFQGVLSKGGVRIIRHQLFKRNEYWFWVGLSDDTAKVSIHLYDNNGKLVEAESWKKGHVAGVRIKPSKTGSYLIRIKVEDAGGSVPWAVIYGFR